MEVKDSLSLWGNSLSLQVWTVSNNATNAILCVVLCSHSPNAHREHPIMFLEQKQKQNIQPFIFLVSLITAGWQYRLSRLMTYNKETFPPHSNTFTYSFAGL